MKGVGYKIIEYTYRIITILHFCIINEEFHNRTAYCIFLKFYAMVTSFHLNLLQDLYHKPDKKASDRRNDLID